MVLQWDGMTSRRAAIKATLGLAAGLLTGTAAYGYAYERHRLELARVTVPVADLPDALIGFRIALLTDLHRSRMVPRHDIDAAVTLALAERPDLVVLGGDYVTSSDTTYVEDVADALGRLMASHGVFAVLGNHDGERSVTSALQRQGISVLRDARTRIQLRGEPVDLIGIRYWTKSADTIAPICRGALPLSFLLAHDPRRFPQAVALKVPLVLSGHTHGGQVVIPGLGAPAARKFPVVSGLAREGRTTLFVSRGVGTVYVPVRLNCPPEVAVLTLARG
jgi:hypothetical protein